MPFIGFLGPTWESAAPTRILRRQNAYYHRLYEYSRGINKNILNRVNIWIFVDDLLVLIIPWKCNIMDENILHMEE